MQLASVPGPVISANRDVAESLKAASALTQQSQAAFEQRGIAGVEPAVLERALGHAGDALRGVDALGANLALDGTFQRYASHSVRHLREAVSMLERPGPLSSDGLDIFERTLFDAEVATRLGSAAGERSLASPALRERERSTSPSGSSSSSSGPAWVDGEWLDELGNPVRGGGDTWSGPDGQRLGSDRSAVDDPGWTGSDGEDFSGI